MTKPQSERPSKKQRELLSFIDGFIKGNGYGPSYREIMRALDYKSVSTVAVHVDGLIARGLLYKKDHSARSLEVVDNAAPAPRQTAKSAPEAWLVDQVTQQVALAEQQADAALTYEDLVTLVDSLRLLQLDDQYQTLHERLQQYHKNQ